MTAKRPEGRTEMSDGYVDLPWKDVQLTELREEDVDLLHRWQTDPRMRDLAMGYRMPIQKQSVREWMDGLRRNQDRAVFGIRVAGQLSGMINLYNIDRLHRQGDIGYTVGGTDGYRKVEVAWVAMILTLDFAFNGLNLHRVSIETIEMNVPIMRGAEAMGFVREGTKRQSYFADGRYWDTHVYGMIAPEFGVVMPTDAHRLCYNMREAQQALSGVFL